MEKIRIILDTDIGDDADDALALCLALKSPELEVVGITTVFRNTAARAKIAVSLLNLMGIHDIPVYAGIGHPLVQPADVNMVPTQLFEDMKDLPFHREMDAVEYLYQTLKQEEEPLTIAAIGPMTNIGLLLRLHPEISSKIREIVIMGGAFYMHYTEWNVFCDPEAADIVFQSGVPVRAIGLDVTTQCQVDDDLIRYLRDAGKPETNLLADLLMCYYNERGRHTFLHDPMAVFAVYDKELITYSGEDIIVELKGEYTRGMTFNRFKIGTGRCRETIRCAKSIQADRFIEKFKEIIVR